MFVKYGKNILYHISISINLHSDWALAIISWTTVSILHEDIMYICKYTLLTSTGTLFNCSFFFFFQKHLWHYSIFFSVCCCITESCSVQWTLLLSQQTITPPSYDALLMSKAFDYSLVETDSSNYLSKSLVFSVMKNICSVTLVNFTLLTKGHMTDRQGLLTSLMFTCKCNTCGPLISCVPTNQCL